MTQIAICGRHHMSLSSARLYHDLVSRRLDDQPELVDEVGVVFTVARRRHVLGARTRPAAAFRLTVYDPIARFITSIPHRFAFQPMSR